MVMFIMTSNGAKKRSSNMIYGPTHLPNPALSDTELKFIYVFFKKAKIYKIAQLKKSSLLKIRTW
jgi:hypothetical protein